MKNRKKSIASEMLKSSAIILFLGSAGVFGVALSPIADGAAYAEGEGGGEGQGSGGEGAGQGQGGGQAGQGNQGSGEGQGGPGEDSDGKGPQAGGPSEDGGGKPVWAQEGIPEVELGRLSVARSPDQVLDRALAEAISGLTPEVVAFYNMSMDEMIASLSLNFDETSFIDSPLQNLALMKDALDGSSVLVDSGVTSNNNLLLAVFLGAASDKTVPISTDTVIAVTTILGTPVTGDAAAALAADAEALRVAILAGHG